MSKWTVLLGVDEDELLEYARGGYQEDLIYGDEAWSGSTLRGKASKYGAGYAESRGNLIDRLSEAGYDLKEVKVGPGRKTLIISDLDLLEKRLFLKLFKSGKLNERVKGEDYIGWPGEDGEDPTVMEKGSVEKYFEESYIPMNAPSQREIIIETA